MLGYPEAALADANSAVKEAREVGQGIPLMYALYFTSYAHIHCGAYAAANVQLDELIPMATEKNASQWRGRHHDANSSTGALPVTFGRGNARKAAGASRRWQRHLTPTPRGF
jgi:hypothetical protein